MPTPADPQPPPGAPLLPQFREHRPEVISRLVRLQRPGDPSFGSIEVVERAWLRDHVALQAAVAEARAGADPVDAEAAHTPEGRARLLREPGRPQALLDVVPSPAHGPGDRIEVKVGQCFSARESLHRALAVHDHPENRALMGPVIEEFRSGEGPHPYYYRTRRELVRIHQQVADRAAVEPFRMPPVTARRILIPLSPPRLE